MEIKNIIVVVEGGNILVIKQDHEIIRMVRKELEKLGNDQN